MHGYLKCYYGYKNWGDELLLFGVLDWIKKYTSVTHVDIEVGDVQRMQIRCSRHQDILNSLGLSYTLVPKKNKDSKSTDVYFFGGGEVINDQDKYILPNKPSLKQYFLFFLSRLFSRSGRNYYLLYYRPIHQGKVYLLGGIGKPYRCTSLILYKLFLPRVRQIVTRDITSYRIAYKYNLHTVLYHDFSDYAIQLFRQKIVQQSDTTVVSGYNPNQYILLNTQSNSWSKEIINTLIIFTRSHPNKIPVYVPCDISDDMNYFPMLKKYIPTLQLYTWTEYDIFQTLRLFANTYAGIGSRLHFLYPLHSFGKKYTSIARTDKVAKLLSANRSDAI